MKTVIVCVCQPEQGCCNNERNSTPQYKVLNQGSFIWAMDVVCKDSEGNEGTKTEVCTTNGGGFMTCTSAQGIMDCADCCNLACVNGRIEEFGSQCCNDPQTEPYSKTVINTSLVEDIETKTDTEGNCVWVLKFKGKSSRLEVLQEEPPIPICCSGDEEGCGKPPSTGGEGEGKPESDLVVTKTFKSSTPPEGKIAADSKEVAEKQTIRNTIMSGALSDKVITSNVAREGDPNSLGLVAASREISYTDSLTGVVWVVGSRLNYWVKK